MDDIDELKSTTHVMTVDTYTSDLIKNSKSIKLNPIYQRGVVWSTRQQSEYIHSVLCNKAPHNIIFNIDKKKIRTCIDGKQRSMSLALFRQNKIPLLYKNKEIYFSELPDDADEEKMLKLTKHERKVFLDRKIGVVDYEQLTYDNQRNLFYHLQFGLPLSNGEKVVALLKKKDNAILFNDFCKRYASDMKKFVKINRKDHCRVIVQYLYMVNTDELDVKAKKVNDYFQELEENGELDSALENIDKKLTYTLEVLGDNEIEKMGKKLFIFLLFIINKKYAIVSKKKTGYVIDLISNFMDQPTVAEYDMTNPLKDVLSHLNIAFKKYFKEYVNNVEDEDCDNDFSDEDDANETDNEDDDKEENEEENDDDEEENDDDNEDDVKEATDDEDDPDDFDENDKLLQNTVSKKKKNSKSKYK